LATEPANDPFCVIVKSRVKESESGDGVVTATLKDGIEILPETKPAPVSRFTSALPLNVAPVGIVIARWLSCR
jgi:hypothetical protein